MARFVLHSLGTRNSVRSATVHLERMTDGAKDINGEAKSCQPEALRSIQAIASSSCLASLESLLQRASISLGVYLNFLCNDGFIEQRYRKASLIKMNSCDGGIFLIYRSGLNFCMLAYTMKYEILNSRVWSWSRSVDFNSFIGERLARRNCSA